MEEKQTVEARRFTRRKMLHSFFTFILSNVTFKITIQFKMDHY